MAQTIQNTANLASSNDIAIDISGQNMQNNIYAYENSGTTVNGNGNIVGSSTGNISGWNVGNTFNLDTSGGGWTSWAQLFNEGRNRLENYRYGRDIIAIDRPLAAATRAGSEIDFTAADGTTLAVETTDSTDTNVTVDLGNGAITNAKVGESYVGNAFTYQADTALYLGGMQFDWIKTYADATIDLKTQASNVEGVDASQSQGNVTALGTDFADNVFAAGFGYNTFFGGYYSNDTYLSNSFGGVTEVLWGAGGGNDVLVQSKETDRLNIANVTLAEISFAGQFGDNFAIALNTGETFVMDGNKDRNVIVAGQEFHYVASTASWSSQQVAVG